MDINTMKYTYEIEKETEMKICKFGLGTPASLVRVLSHCKYLQSF